MKQILKYILSIVLDNLKMAENKHGVVLALNSGLIVITVGFFSSAKLVITLLNWLVILFASISIFCCFLGLYARNIKVSQKKNFTEKISLLYYKDLSAMSPEELLNCIIINYGLPNNYQYDGFEYDLAKSVIANSKIASKKYFFFNYSILFLSIAVFIDVILMLIVGIIN